MDTTGQVSNSSVFFYIDRGEHVLCADCGQVIRRIYKKGLKHGMQQSVNRWSAGLTCDRCEQVIPLEGKRAA